MPDHDALDERLRAVERALTDADDDLTDLREAAATARELETLSERLDTAEERLDELDAATQALRGYVGNVRAVNRSVEQTANAALATAEEVASDDLDPGSPESVHGRSCECAPCGCAARQPGRAEPPEETSSSDDQPEERGLLGRIASSLASALTGTREEFR